MAKQNNTSKAARKGSHPARNMYHCNQNGNQNYLKGKIRWKHYPSSLHVYIMHSTRIIYISLLVNHDFVASTGFGTTLTYPSKHVTAPPFVNKSKRSSNPVPQCVFITGRHAWNLDILVGDRV